MSPVVNQIPGSSIRGALAIGAEFKDTRLGAPVLQQRLYVLGQGKTDAVYANEKFLASSSGEVGAKVGYGSPLHLMARQLFPADRKGAASVECTFFPLDDDPSGVAWEGTIDGVGVMTATEEYVLRIADFLFPFTLAKDTTAEEMLDIVLAAIQANISAPFDVTKGAASATKAKMLTGTVDDTIGTWTAVTDGALKISLAAEDSLTGLDFNAATDMDDVALVIDTALTELMSCVWDTDHFVFEADVAEEASISALSAGASGTDISGALFCNGLTGVAVLTPGTDADNELTMVAKWKGATSEELGDMEIVGDLAGITFLLNTTATGAGDPSIQPAVDAMGDTIWYTMVANQMANATAFGILSIKGEAQWDPFAHRPFIAAAGGSDRSAAESIADARKTDRTNMYVLLDGAQALTFEIGARGIASMAARANATPHRPYTGLQMTGITPGADSAQPSYTAGDTSEKKGVSTSLIVSGVVELEDMIMFYHPDDEQPDPGYRYANDVVKIQNVINSLNLKFGSADWKGMTILADDDVSDQSDVRRPKDAKGAVFGLMDDWVGYAWCTDALTMKANLFLEKASGVRNRFEGIIAIFISDALRQQDYLVRFGFKIT